MVSVEARRADATVKQPNIHYALAASAGRLDGLVSGLAPQTAYVLAVRTHRSGCAEDGGNGTFSELTFLAGSCSTLNISEEVEEIAADAATTSRAPPPTRWLEVFRYTEGGRTLPDFLDNHDSGDMGGDGGITFGDGIITRYCVEMLNTTVEGTTTTTFEGAPVASAFADYRSTNPPWLLKETATPYFNFTNWLASAEVTLGTEYASWCDLLPDRMWGHLSRASLLAASCDANLTSPNHSLCRCSEHSAAASRLYTGMTPIGFPFFVSTAVPGVYPGARPTPIGHWYSHPVGGRCPLGAPVGQGGCTWQRAPLSHSIFTSDLLENGWDNSSWWDPTKPSSPDLHQPEEMSLHNMALFRKLWAAKGLAPCGQA